MQHLLLYTLFPSSLVLLLKVLGSFWSRVVTSGWIIYLLQKAGGKWIFFFRNHNSNIAAFIPIRQFWEAYLRGCQGNTTQVWPTSPLCEYYYKDCPGTLLSNGLRGSWKWQNSTIKLHPTPPKIPYVTTFYLFCIFPWTTGLRLWMCKIPFFLHGYQGRWVLQLKAFPADGRIL